MKSTNHQYVGLGGPFVHATPVYFILRPPGAFLPCSVSWAPCPTSALYLGLRAPPMQYYWAQQAQNNPKIVYLGASHPPNPVSGGFAPPPILYSLPTGGQSVGRLVGWSVGRTQCISCHAHPAPSMWASVGPPHQCISCYAHPAPVFWAPCPPVQCILGSVPLPCSIIGPSRPKITPKSCIRGLRTPPNPVFSSD